MTELLLCDWHECVRLLNNNHDMAIKLLKMLLKQLPDDLLLMQQHVRTAKYNDLLAVVHKLHGVLCYISLPRLKSVVQKTEIFLRSDNSLVTDHKAVADLVNLIAVEIETIIAADFTSVLVS